MAKIRVLIVDDHNLFRRGLRRLLEDFDELQIVGEAANGQEALALAEQRALDVVLMDVQMPVMSGPEATRHFREQFPNTRVVMLTVSDRDEDLFEAIRAGAQGYLLKNVQTTDLINALVRVNAGDAIIAPAMAGRLLREFRNLAKAAPQAEIADELEGLSEREIDVLRLVAQGLANKEIADALGLSEHTVKTHLRNILDKLHLRSRTHAAAFAVQAGLVSDVRPAA